MEKNGITYVSILIALQSHHCGWIRSNIMYWFPQHHPIGWYRYAFSNIDIWKSSATGIPKFKLFISDMKSRTNIMNNIGDNEYSYLTPLNVTIIKTWYQTD